MGINRIVRNDFKLLICLPKKNKMTHKEDNMDRIQAKLQGVSIAEFGKFVDFVNNEFKTVYKQFDELNQECVEFEERTRLRHLSIIKSHNQLIDTLTEYQISFHAVDRQYLHSLNDCKIDLENFEISEDEGFATIGIFADDPFDF